MKYLVGLLGYPLEHSFSPHYFSNFFKTNNLPYEYHLFEYAEIKNFINAIPQYRHLIGFNITHPHKENILPYLTNLSTEARSIGAVNCVKIIHPQKLVGYNTDAYGFEQLIQPYISQITKALIFGSGGASKAVAFILKKYQIPFLIVSRNPSNTQITYNDLFNLNFDEYNTFINTTPVGQYPNISKTLSIPFNKFSNTSIAIDLIYNPEETLFLRQAKMQGATCINGKKMLIKQAEKSFEIWQS